MATRGLTIQCQQRKQDGGGRSFKAVAQYVIFCRDDMLGDVHCNRTSHFSVNARVHQWVRIGLSFRAKGYPGKVIEHALSAFLSHATMPPSQELPTSPLPKRPRIDMSSSSIPKSPASTSVPPPSFSTSPPLLVKKLSAHAKTPTRGSAFAAGYDVYSAKECLIPKRGKGLVDTDISIAVGEGCCKLPTAYEDGMGTC